MSNKKNYYSSIKFSERLAFETAIRQWQSAANAELSTQEIETVVSGIRQELSSCSSLEEVQDTMSSLNEQAAAFALKTKLKDSTNTEFRSTHYPMKRSTYTWYTTKTSQSSILPGCSLVTLADNRSGQITHKKRAYDLLDSPLLEKIGQGESSMRRNEMRDELIAIAKTSSFRAGDRVVRAGSVGDSMFFISKGSLKVMVNGVHQRGLAEGECFGEDALATARFLRERETLELLGHGIRFDTVIHRTADVDCVEDAVLLEWSVDALSPLLDRVPRLEHNLQRIGLDTLQQSVASGSAPGHALLDLISHVHPLLLTGLFKGVDPARIVDACAILAAAPIRRPAGAWVVRQGGVGETLFVVVSGLLSCRDQGREVCQFGPGRFFGELCLCAKVMLRRRFLPPSPPASSPGAAFIRSPGLGGSDAVLEDALRNCFVRTADVVCLEDAVLIELSAEEMELLFAVAPEVYGNLYAVARDRLMEAAARHSATAHQAFTCRETAVMETSARRKINETFIRLSLASESAGVAAHGQKHVPRVAAALKAIRGAPPPFNTPSALGRTRTDRRGGAFR